MISSASVARVDPLDDRRHAAAGQADGLAGALAGPGQALVDALGSWPDRWPSASRPLAASSALLSAASAASWARLMKLTGVLPRAPSTACRRTRASIASRVRADHYDVPPCRHARALPADDLYARLEVPSTPARRRSSSPGAPCCARHHPDVAGPDGLERGQAHQRRPRLAERPGPAGPLRPRAGGRRGSGSAPRRARAAGRRRRGRRRAPVRRRPPTGRAVAADPRAGRPARAATSSTAWPAPSRRRSPSSRRSAGSSRPSWRRRPRRGRATAVRAALPPAAAASTGDPRRRRRPTSPSSSSATSSTSCSVSRSASAPASA